MVIPKAGVALALGRRRMTATFRQSVWSRELSARDDGLPDPAEIAQALEELRREIAPSERTLRIALLPPLVAGRRLELPRARDHEIRSVVTAAPGKYFLDPSPITAAVVPDPEDRGSPRGYWVTGALTLLLDHLHLAAANCGWTRVTVGSGYDAWLAAARSHWPVLSSGSATILLRGDSGLEALVLQSGRLHLVRRFPGSMEVREVAKELGIDRVAVLGSPADSVDLRSALRDAGLDVTAEPPADRGAEPGLLAARFAGAGAELVPDRIRTLREGRGKRLSLRLYGAAAALLLLAAGADLWGQHRELAHARAARARQESRVARALTLRDGIASVESRVQALRDAEAGASRWGTVLSGVAEHLPRDAYLVGFAGSRDSLRLDGRAARAAGVFESLQRAPMMAEVRADAPIRQEARDSGPAVESFSAAAVVVRGARR